MIDDIEPPSPLFAALENSDDAAAIRAIESGCDINAKDNRNIMGNGQTPLHVAAQHDNGTMITMLTEAGADINSTDDYGRTPIWIACSNGDYRAVVTLLAAGADATIPDCRGTTPHSYISERLGRYMAVLDAIENSGG
ncbi:ankyrin repeat domain-containing protein [Crateriforma spongiae]|uniref:ankyrin repeat domain-containing protein n=1 Tax=Crateriforma spongiae TaxID=2724528 RepID=UPI0039B06770